MTRASSKLFAATFERLYVLRNQMSLPQVVLSGSALFHIGEVR